MIRESNIVLRQPLFSLNVPCTAPSENEKEKWIAMEPSEVFARFPKVHAGLVKPLLQLDPDYELLMCFHIKEYVFTRLKDPMLKPDCVLNFANHFQSVAASYPAALWLGRHLSAGTLPPEFLKDNSEDVAQKWYEDYSAEITFPFFQLSGKSFFTFARHWHVLIRTLGLDQDMYPMHAHVCELLDLFEYPSDLPQLE